MAKEELFKKLSKFFEKDCHLNVPKKTSEGHENLSIRGVLVMVGPPGTGKLLLESKA